MTVLKIFVSYSSKNRAIVKRLVHDLEAMGHDVWMDTNGLTGGHEWWAKILEEIRQCDLFVAALTTRYFNSEPCIRELNYARAFGKLILPVSFANISPQTLPSYMQKIQIIDYQHANKPQLLILVRTLNSLPQPSSLPEPLLEEPEIPLPPIAKIRDRIENFPPQVEEQRNIIYGLKDLTENEDCDLEAWELLEQLSERDDLFKKLDAELSAIIARKPDDINYRRRLAALEPRTFVGHTGAVTSVGFSPYAEYILTGSEDFTVRLWDALTGKELNRLENHGKVRSVAFSPNGQLIAAGGEHPVVRVWDVSAGTLFHELVGHTDIVTGVTFSPNAECVITSSEDDTVILWSTESGEEIRRFKPSGGYGASAVVSSPDGQYIVSGHDNKIMYLWDRALGNEIRRFTGHTGFIRSISYSPDGEHILSTGSDQTTRLWESKTGKLVRVFTGHENSVISSSFSKNGRYIATSCFNGTLRIWNARTGKQLLLHDRPTFGLWTGVVTSVVFSPDDQFLLVGTTDKKVILCPSGIET